MGQQQMHRTTAKHHVGQPKSSGPQIYFRPYEAVSNKANR